MSDEQPDDLAEVQRRLAEIQAHKRGKVRWNLSRHTAEVALDAIGGGRESKRPRTVCGKQRRRKRHKRLL